MPRRITIKSHLDLRELEARYRRARDPVERSHYQIIWLLAQGKPTEEVASITGYSRSWIYELVWGYNRIGPETLGDKRHELPGAEPLLNEEQRQQLAIALQSPPPEGGQWNSTKVAAWMSQRLGRPISRQRGWEYLKLLKARPRSVEVPSNRASMDRRSMSDEVSSDTAEQVCCKKNASRLRRVRVENY